MHLQPINGRFPCSRYFLFSAFAEQTYLLLQSWEERIKKHFRILGILTICFSVYLLDESRFTASIWPKSISCPRRKINSNLQTYFFFWYPSNCLSPERKRWTFEAVKWSLNKLALDTCNKIISLLPKFGCTPYNISLLYTHLPLNLFLIFASSLFIRFISASLDLPETIWQG